MSRDVEGKLPLSRAFFYIMLSVVLLWGTLFVAWWYHGYTFEKKQKNAAFQLRTILSSSKTQDSLTAKQLTTLLGLSEDAPNIYSIDPYVAKQTLENYPAIKSAKVLRLRPNALFVDYELRTPYFRLIDFENMAVDNEGYPFYLYPIFTPKKIPELYLGLQNVSWNTKNTQKEFALAVDVAEFIQKEYPNDLHLVRIDTHNVQNPSLGAQEIVIVFKDAHSSLYARLDVQDYKTGLKRLLRLRNGEARERVVDLRSRGFALVKDSMYT
jgi:cell division septal protein FtsQ